MSGTINNGGPAFPTPVCEEPHCEVCESKSAGTGIFFGGTQGMTMRDYFAARAMQTMLQPGADVDYWKAEYQEPGEDWKDCLAMVSYSVADAMLRARGAK